MDFKIFAQTYAEFYELFNGLTAEEAVNKAEEMGLTFSYDNDCELVDINFKNICATVATDNGHGHVCRSYECYNDEGELVGVVD